MDILSRFFDRDASERWRLVAALLVVAATRAGLLFLPVAAVRRIADRMGGRHARSMDSTTTPEEVGRAVRAASRAVPGATCLVQAVAAEALLRRRGQPARLAMGLARDEAGRLAGHAWLECHGRVVVGGGEKSRYVRLAGVEGAGRRMAPEA